LVCLWPLPWGVLAVSKRHSLCLYGVFRELVLVRVLFKLHDCIGMVFWLMASTDGLFPLFLLCSVSDATLP
jgi:hypothetical protein